MDVVVVRFETAYRQLDELILKHYKMNAQDDQVGSSSQMSE